MQFGQTYHPFVKFEIDKPVILAFQTEEPRETNYQKYGVAGRWNRKEDAPSGAVPHSYYDVVMAVDAETQEPRTLDVSGALFMALKETGDSIQPYNWVQIVKVKNAKAKGGISYNITVIPPDSDIPF